MQPHHLCLRSLELTFNQGRVNEVRALRGLSLDVDAGEFVVVVGSNGAGKSTMLNAIAGVHLPDRGTIELAGTDLTEQADHRRARVIGRVFQDPLAGTAPSLTIEENLMLAERRGRRRRFRRPSNPARREEALASLGMGLEHRLRARVSTLSGGQRQALSVLMAMQAEPSLLLLDEHTAALDPGAAHRVLDVSTRLAAERGITTLMVTHNMTHAVEVGDRTVMLHEGRTLFDLHGEERANLTVADLVARFHELAGDGLTDREMLSAPPSLQTTELSASTPVAAQTGRNQGGSR